MEARKDNIYRDRYLESIFLPEQTLLKLEAELPTSVEIGNLNSFDLFFDISYKPFCNQLKTYLILWVQKY